MFVLEGGGGVRDFVEENAFSNLTLIKLFKIKRKILTCCPYYLSFFQSYL